MCILWFALVDFLTVTAWGYIPWWAHKHKRSSSAKDREERPKKINKFLRWTKRE